MSVYEGLVIVSRYILKLPPQEWVTVPEAAALLSASQSKITTWIREGRLDATNVASKGKRASYRISRNDLRNIRPAANVRQSRKLISTQRSIDT